MSKLPDAAAIESNMSYFGFDNRMAGAWLTPNGAGMVRVCVMGLCNIIAFPLAEILQEGFSQVDQSSVTVDMVSEYVLNLMSGSEFGYVATVKQDDAIYVPQGWIVCERCMAVGLMYGIRKSYLLHFTRTSLALITAR